MSFKKSNLPWLLPQHLWSWAGVIGLMLALALAWWWRQRRSYRLLRMARRPVQPAGPPQYTLGLPPEHQFPAQKRSRTIEVAPADEAATPARPGGLPEPPVERLRPEPPVERPEEEEEEQLPGAMADFDSIEGIDETLTELLYAAGITSFEELAATSLDRLAQILDDAEQAEVDPTTWPEQARLIVEGKWDELQALQNDLQANQPPTRGLDIEA